MTPFTWLLWAILAIPVILVLGAVLVVVVGAVSQARKGTRLDATTARQAHYREIVARQDAANKRRDAAVAALRRDIERQALPPRYGVRTPPPTPSEAPPQPDLSWLDKEDRR